jgi:phosphoglycolate phosphatase-like HAD superfamily hydrolase
VAARENATLCVNALALELDGVLCDTRALWRDWLASVEPVLGVAPAELPADRAEAAAALDREGAGNWRTLLGRWSEERAAVYFRRDAQTSEKLRALEGSGRRMGAFTDAPAELAAVALAHIGAARRLAALETGAFAKERLLELLGEDAVVIETRDELLEIAP